MLLLAPMLVAPVAMAQQHANDRANDRTVVVTGTRDTTAKQAEHFVRRVVSTNTGQLARFVEPVCPQVLGVPPSVAGAMEERIRRVAANAHVRLAPVKCKPNLVAIVAKNADAFIKFMRKRHSSFFDDLSDIDLDDAFRSGAVHSWRLVEARDEAGALGFVQ